MIKVHLYTGRAPFAMPLNENPLELSPEYVQEAIAQACEDAKVKYVSHQIDVEEIRDGTIIEGGIEMMASKRDYYLVIQTEPLKNVPKGK